MKRSPKIKSLKELQKICRQLRKERKTIGLITGCFDVIHVNHIQFLKFGKTKVDILVIGIDNDKTIKISKGPSRPIFNINQRVEVLSEIQSVDFIFKIPQVFEYSSQDAELIHEKIIQRLDVNAIITAPRADKYWRQKRDRARNLGVKLYKDPRNKTTSSTKIIQYLGL